MYARLNKYILTLSILIASSSAGASENPSQACHGLIADSVELQLGTFASKASVEAVIAGALEVRDKHPFGLELIFKLAGDPNLKMETSQLAEYPLSARTVLFSDDGNMLDLARTVLQAMKVVGPKGTFMAMRSPYKTEVFSNDLNIRVESEKTRLTDEELKVYFERVRGIVEKIVLTMNEEGLSVSRKEHKFLHPSSHIIERNGGIGLAFESSTLKGLPTLPAFLLTPWGRYDIYVEELDHFNSRSEAIKKRLKQEFGLRLIQSEMVGFFDEGEVYEMTIDSEGSSLPSVFDKQGRLSGREIDEALIFSGIKKKKPE